MNRFMDALEQGNLETLRKYPKADLHNHFAPVSYTHLTLPTT